MNYPSELQQKMAAAQAQCFGNSVIGAGTMSQLQAAQSDRPSTEIEGCLSRANSALARLHDRISAVEDRVRPVMRATGSGQNGCTGKPQEAMSPLGDAITGMEDCIDSAVDRLEALLLGLAL